MSTVAEVGERAVVAWLRQRLARPHPHLTLGIGDDAAVFALPGQTVATVDAVTAGVDWLVDATPRAAIGHRAAAVNLSDLAAMGATPALLLLSLELPGALPMVDLQAAVEGLCALCEAHDVAVAGGDVGMGEGPEHWSVTAIGWLQAGPMRRDRARAGDVVWLVGQVGAAAVGLAALRARWTGQGLQGCVRAHRWPGPQIEAGKRLQATGQRLAAIDISDGLWLDASRLAQASGLELVVNLPRPSWCDPGVERDCLALGIDWRQACATGGDDYALLVTADPELDVAGLLVGLAETVTRLGFVRAPLTHPGAVLTVDGVPFTGAPAGHLHGDR